MIRRVMVIALIRVILPSRKSWFKTMAEVREFSVRWAVELVSQLSACRKFEWRKEKLEARYCHNRR